MKSALFAVLLSSSAFAATITRDGYVVDVTPEFYPKIVRIGDSITISITVFRPDGTEFFSHWFKDTGSTSHSGITNGPNGFVLASGENSASLTIPHLDDSTVGDYYLFVYDKEFTQAVNFEDGRPDYFSPTGSITLTTDTHFNDLSPSLQNYFIASGQAAAAGVPEPTVSSLLLLAVAGLAGFRRRKG